MREPGTNRLWETQTETYRLVQGADLHDERLVDDEATLDLYRWYKTKVIPRKMSHAYHLPYDDDRILGTHESSAHPTDSPNTPYFYAVETAFSGYTGSLTTRTDDETGTLLMNSGHGITTGMVIDLHWATGARFGITVGTVSGNSVPIGADNSGTGDVLPTAGTTITVYDQSAAIYCYTGFNKRAKWKLTRDEIQDETGIVLRNGLKFRVLGNDNLVIYYLAVATSANIATSPDVVNARFSDNSFILILNKDQSTIDIATYTKADIVSAVVSLVDRAPSSAGDPYGAIFHSPTVTDNYFWLMLSTLPGSPTGGEVPRQHVLMRFDQAGTISTKVVFQLGYSTADVGGLTLPINARMIGVRDRINFLYSRQTSTFDVDTAGMFLSQYGESGTMTQVGTTVEVRPVASGDFAVNTFAVPDTGEEILLSRLYSDGSFIPQTTTGSGHIDYRINYDRTVGPDFAEAYTIIQDIDQFGYRYYTDTPREVTLNLITPTNVDDIEDYEVPRLAIKRDDDDTLRYRLRLSTTPGTHYEFNRWIEKLAFVYRTATASGGENVTPNPASIDDSDHLTAKVLDFYDLRMGFRYATIVFPKAIANVYFKHASFYTLVNLEEV